MRRALVALLVLLAGTGAAQARFEGNLNLFAGQNWLRNGDWAPVEQQQEFGVLLSFAEERAPVQFALDYLRSSDEVSSSEPPGTPVEGTSTEFGIGVRKIWGRGLFHPHLGAGGVVIDAEMSVAETGGPVELHDRGYGIWVDGGFSWRLFRHLNLGVELRYSRAKVDLSSGFSTIDAAAGGFHAGAIVGFGW